MKTPATQLIVDAVEAEFGSKVRTGAWLCRRIAGTLTWSQHSWTEADKGYAGNAADIFPDTMAIGDAVFTFIVSNFPAEVKTILWRVKNHFDHVHVDTWPTGIATPPCVGGGLLVKHRDGRVAGTFGAQAPAPVPPPPPIPVPIPPIMEDIVPPITPDSPPEAIRFIQLLINDVFGQGMKANGIWGEGMEKVVINRLLDYTSADEAPKPDPEIVAGRFINAAMYKGLFRDWVRDVTT